MGISVEIYRVALLSTARLNWNLEMLVFVKGGKPEYPEKTFYFIFHKNNRKHFPYVSIEFGNTCESLGELK